MSEREPFGGERIGDLFAELFGPDGGFLLWSRDPKRKESKEAPGYQEATDTKDNDRIHIRPQDALLLLRYLEKHKARLEQAIVDEVLKQAKYGR